MTAIQIRRVDVAGEKHGYVQFVTGIEDLVRKKMQVGLLSSI